MATNQQVHFKTTDQLFNKIKEDFNSFDSGNLLDEGKFYSDVKYIIGRLGISWYKSEEEILEVENFKTKLPDNFHLLDVAYRCTNFGEFKTVPGVIFSKLTFDKFNENNDTHIAGSCDESCNPCSKSKPLNCIFNSYEQILVQRPNGIFEYGSPKMLKIGNVNSKRFCSSQCPNIYSTSLDTISIQNGHIYTNFCDGNIYIQYTAFPKDEETGLPLIPDNIFVEKAIEYYIKSRLIENLWVNGDADVAQKVSYFNSQFQVALGDAINESKTPSFNTMVQMVRRTKKRLNTYQIN